MASITQPVLANSFAAGSSGTAIPAGPGGGANASLGTADGALFDTIIATGGTLKYGTIAGRPACIVTLTSAATCAVLWTGAGMIINTAAQTWFRQYLDQAWPASACPVGSLQVSGTKCADIVLNANGTLTVRDANSSPVLTTTTAVPNGGLYRIEGYVTSSATAGQVELKLFTSPDSATATETRTSGVNVDTTGGLINQVRFGASSAGPVGATWGFTGAAVSTTGYIGPGPVVFHLAAGAPTPSGFTVTSKPVGGTSLRLKVATDPALTQNVTYVAAQAPDAYGYVKHVVTGLGAATVYYCQLADTPPGGSEALCGPVAQCTTLPPAGKPATFTVALGSCIDTGDDQSSPVAALTDWVGYGPGLAVYTGDYDYLDPVETTVIGQLGCIEYQSMYWMGAPLTEQAWGYYCRSDHDTTTDGGDSDNAWTAANLLAMQEAFPYVASLPDPNNPVHGLYQSWVTGRVRFIMLDLRNIDRSPVANPDNSSKTMLGANQLAWLYGQLVQPEPLKVIISDTNWIGATTSANSCGPGWTFYTTERAAILAYIAANQHLVQNVMLWHGDAHGLGCCPGASNPNGGFPVYCAAPMRQTGVAFSAGLAATFTQSYNNSGGECRQYGRITLTDTGATITSVFTGWDALNQVARISQTDTFPAQAAGANAFLTFTV